MKYCLQLWLFSYDSRRVTSFAWRAASFFMKTVFFIGDISIASGSRARITIFQRFWELGVLLARKFELTKTSRQSLRTAYDCCLAHRTSSYTPPGASLKLAGRGWLWGAVRLPASEVKTFSWGSFFVSCCVPQISTTAVPESQGVDLC